MAYFVLSVFESPCEGNQLQCFSTSGVSVLRYFSFENINPYIHIVVGFRLLFMNVVHTGIGMCMYILILMYMHTSPLHREYFF